MYFVVYDYAKIRCNSFESASYICAALNFMNYNAMIVDEDGHYIQ